jgi:very-short-patch-repair endonuclease
MTPTDVEGAITDFAGRQHGIVARRQLIHAGLSVAVVRTRVRSGRLRPVFRGVYLAGPSLTPGARELAAVLASGRGAVLSHRSAGHIWGITPPRSADAPVDVSITADRNGGRRPGIRVHRVQRLPQDETTVRNGIPVTTPARTLSDLAGVLGARQLEQALATAERLDLIDRTQVVTVLDRSPRRPGARALRTLVERKSELAFTRSEAEERLLKLVERAGLQRPALNARVAQYQVDFLFRGSNVVVEVDGFAYHSSRRMFERDRSRDADLQSRGYRILRVTSKQLSEQPEAVLARLAATLAVAAMMKH